MRVVTARQPARIVRQLCQPFQQLRYTKATTCRYNRRGGRAQAVQSLQIDQRGLP